MNGATAEPWLKTIKIPNKAKTIIIGNNQYFFLTFIIRLTQGNGTLVLLILVNMI